VVVRRRTFVGRTHALQQLAARLAEADAGEARVVVIEGSPGIGKSALADEFLRRAHQHGARVVTASCHEGVVIPYLPVAALLRPFLHEPQIRVQLTPGEVAALEPFLDPGQAVATEIADDEDRADPRRSLFLAATRVLLCAAIDRTLVLLFEDAQWADRESLELVAHLVASANHESASAGVRLLVVLTQRAGQEDTAAGRILARLRRETGTQRLLLGPLDEVEVNQLVSEVRGRPSQRELGGLMAASGGNPLILHSMLDQMDAGRATQSERPIDLGHELRARLDAVAPRTREVLTTAAFLGDGGVSTLLRAAVDLDASDFADALDEAEDADLLVEDDEHYRFTHPELCHLLYSGPSTRRRQRLHGAIAERLTDHYGDDAEYHALELWHHLSRAGSSVDGAALAHFASAAALQASAVGAWGEASLAYDDALRSSVPGAMSTRQRCELLVRRAWAHYHDYDFAVCVEAFGDAVAVSRDADEIDLWASAVLGLTRARLTRGVTEVGRAIDTSEAHEFIDRVGDRRPRERARLLALLAEARFSAFEMADGLALCEEARRSAEQVGDDVVLSSVDFAEGLQRMGRLELREARDRFTAAAERARAADSDQHLVWALGRLPIVSWISGELARADREAMTARAAAASSSFRAGEPLYQWGSMSLADAVRTGVAVARGRYSDVEHHASEAILGFHRSEYSFTPSVVFPQLACARALRGDSNGAEEALDDWAAIGGRGIRRFRVLVAVAAGDRTAARAAVEAGLWRPRLESDSLFGLSTTAGQVEVAAVIGDLDLAVAALPHVESLHERGVRFAPDWCLFVPRLYGMALAMADRHDDALRVLDEASRLAHRADSPVEVARVELERARLLASTDPPLALTVAARAAEQLDRLGMLPTLRDARELVERIESQTGVSASLEGRRQPSVKVLLITDLVDSTPLNVRAGDEAYLELLREHNSVIRGRLREFDGVEFKHTGDGICAWFSSARKALLCANSLQPDLDQVNASHPDLPLVIRVGLAAGEPVVEGDDLFGLAVVRASRICAQAGAGQVLFSDEVARLADVPEDTLDFVGKVALKGLPEETTLYEVRAPVVR
jgi:class 3 adenylate cyclase